jgi:hypothetical protein
MSTIAAWSHLPNAAHIDQVLNDHRVHSVKFADARQHVTRDTSKDTVWWAAWDAASDLGRNTAWDAASDIVIDSGSSNAVSWDAWFSATDAVLALLAYDCAGEYLDISAAQALVWGEIRCDDSYLLLKPYLIVRVAIALKLPVAV